jgi:hypothetical protein
MPSILFRPKPNVDKTPAAPKASPLCCGQQNQLTKSSNMSTELNNHSTKSRVPGTVAISDDEMRRFAPSVFASQPIEGVSERCRFLPTSSHSQRDARKWLGSSTRIRAEHLNGKHGAASRNTLSGLLGLSRPTLCCFATHGQNISRSMVRV